MKPISFALVFVLSAVTPVRASDTSPVCDGRTPRPFYRAPIPSHDSVPGFGTVLEQWTLEMSGRYAGAGITWVRDSGKFYLMDQGYSGPYRVWNLDPADPAGTIESVPWTLVNLGEPEADIPYGIAWDNDSGCFWTSQIVDGHTDAGCYLLRYVWNGSRWVWAGTARDSWKVGDGWNGGGLECFWLGGMERSAVDGRFYGAPVSTSAGGLNHIVRFDPYNKANLGRLVYGDDWSERGCTFIPWDSSYVLTCGWNSGSYRKRDSTGYLLSEASAGHSPADWSLHVPNDISSGDTVCAYCINSMSGNCLQRISVGMLWDQLPSALPHNIQPERILAPNEVADSGETVVPRLVVSSTEEAVAESVRVHLAIDNQVDRIIYHDSLVVALAPESVDTLEFAAWTVTGRDSMRVTAWTNWAGDSVPEDDTLSRRFLVRAVDAGITEVFSPVPWDTIDPDAVFPSCVLWNFGNVTLSFPMVFGIGTYCDTLWVRNLVAGGSRPVTAVRPWTAMPGTWQCLMNAAVTGDLHPENNDTTYWFVVRGTIDHDIMVGPILVPSGIMDTTPFQPTVEIYNNAADPDSFRAWFWITDTVGSQVYMDSLFVMLLDTLVTFRPCTLRIPGYYMASCSVYLAEDQNRLNDVRYQGFRVAPGAGMAERPKLKPAEQVPEPTVVRGLLSLGPAGMTNGQVQMTLLDITGRRVMGLKPGENDISHLAPGVYYIRVNAGDCLASRKLVKLQ
jgi:hypothetical protein